MASKCQQCADWASLPSTVGNGDVYRHAAPSHSHSLLQSLQTLWEAGHFCDVKVVVEGEALPAHRLVLAGASSYFRAMFTLGLREQGMEEVVIQDVRASIFKAALHFMYSGVVDITSENCQELLALANMMGLSHVVQACSVFLTTHLAPDNCIGICSFADMHSVQTLKEKAEAYIFTHFLQLSSTEEFLELEKEVLITLLQSEHLAVESETQVLEAALAWISHSLKDRRQHFFDVMSAVRVTLIPRKQLEEVIHGCVDLSLRVALKKLQQEFHQSRWQGHRPTLPVQPRRSACKLIFILGGYSRRRGAGWKDTCTLMTVECFDLVKQLWTIRPCMSEMRNGHGAAVLEGMIYVAGGESESLIFDSVERFNPVTNEWELRQPLILPRYGLGLVASQGTLLAIGGWVGSEIGRNMERYLPETDTWIPEGPMETPRFAAGVVEHEGLVYVVGGLTELGTDVAVVDAYNPVTREWQTLPSLSKSRAYVAVTAADGFIYAAGGWNESMGALDFVERYSIVKEQWLPLPPLKNKRAGASAVVVNKMLYVIGGRTRSRDELLPVTLDSMECMDLVTFSWLDVPSIPMTRCEAAVAVI